MSDKNVSDMTDDEIRAMAGASDPVAAYLTKVRQDIDRLGVLYDAGYAVSAQEWGTSMQACADDVPRLLAAVETAVKDHQPASPGLYPVCKGCDGQFWPCPPYRAITAALLGKEDTNA